jgi:VTC domain
MINTQIQATLSLFETFSLKQLEAANLLERKDFKYTFHVKHLDFVLQQIQPYYSLLSINNNLYTDYLTEYYDTKGFKFYLQHHNGETNRYKVRLRNYVQSAIYYYEVKFKNNKNWTSKYREKIKSLDTDINQFTTNITSEPLEKKLKVAYSRITMLSKDHSEKVTFDIGLKYSSDTEAQQFDYLCIAEVKSKSHHPYIFRQIIKTLGYRVQGLSKYCFGIASLYSHLKSNNFKQSFLYIRKLNK